MYKVYCTLHCRSFCYVRLRAGASLIQQQKENGPNPVNVATTIINKTS
jgi:hypothetical protein